MGREQDIRQVGSDESHLELCLKSGFKLRINENTVSVITDIRADFVTVFVDIWKLPERRVPRRRFEILGWNRTVVIASCSGSVEEMVRLEHNAEYIDRL